MAFVVPVVRNGKDFSLYRSTTSNNSAKNGRSNSIPIKIVAKSAETIRLEQALARQAESRRVRQYSVCAATSSQSSPSSISQRRSSRRVSIRHFSSLDSTESNATTDSRRRVRFGHCEEIEYSSEEEGENPLEPKQDNKVTHIRDEKPVHKLERFETRRQRSVSLMDVEPEKCFNRHKEPSQFVNFLRVAKLASPLN